MTVVIKLHEKTEQLKSCLAQGMPSRHRDEYIERVQTLLDDRQKLFDQLPITYTKEEKKLGAEIISMNKEIDQQLKRQAKVLKDELEQFQRKKKRSQQYANPYAQISVDGMFFDKKN